MKSIIAAVALLPLAGCMGVFAMQGSGKRATETRTPSPFTKVRLEGSADVKISSGPTASVVVETDDNLLPIITTDVSGDTLVISSKKGFSTRIGVHVTIVTPNIAGVDVTGSGNIDVDGVKGTAFDAVISGSGNVTVNGSADKVSGSVTGSGDLDLSALHAKDADVEVSGSGNVSVFASDSLKAEVTGSGDIAYTGGTKKVDKNVTGSGSVHQKN